MKSKYEQFPISEAVCQVSLFTVAHGKKVSELSAVTGLTQLAANEANNAASSVSQYFNVSLQTNTSTSVAVFWLSVTCVSYR